MLYRNGKQIGFILKDGKNIDIAKLYSSTIFKQGYIIEEHSVIPAELDDTIGKDLLSYKIIGRTKIEVRPGTENPIVKFGVGDLIKEGEHTGKYLIPVVIKENFINTEAITIGKEIKDGIIIDNENCWVSDYIPVNHYVTYIANGIFENIIEYDENYSLIQSIKMETVNGNRKYTPSINAKYVKISSYNTNLNNARFQPHKDNLDYNDFQEPIYIDIYLPVPLYDGDYILFKENGNGILHQEYGLSFPKEINISLPKLPTFKDEITPNGLTTIIDINTTIRPKEFYCKYKSARHYNPQLLKTFDLQDLQLSNGEKLYTRR